MKMKKCILFTALFLFIFARATAQQSNQNKIEELEAQVAELDKTFNVSARKYVSAYFDLSDEYYTIKDYEKAYTNAVKGLRLDSYNMPMQYRAAEYEINNQQYDLAYPRLTYIIEKDDEQKTAKAAKKLLKKIPKDKISELEKLVIQPMFEKSILVVFYPGVEDVYKSAIAQRIEQEYKLTVKTADFSEQENTGNLRNNWDDYLDETVNDVLSRSSEMSLEQILNAWNLTLSDLETSEGKEAFLVNLFLMLGYPEQDYLDFKAQYEDQYDANALINQVKKNYKIDSDCFGILAVTAKDIYSGSENNNFLFGLSSGNTAVMSLNRFVKYTDDKSIAMKRTVMQAFSSVGHVIGIARCSTPLCARAYPNSLAEQDAKDDVLCQTCINNVNKLYASLKQ
ncbi:MAG: hypothetical protein J5726_00840 [Treponema sp.]|nr:hypothetical protein [Treponema sp.]